MPGYPYKTVSPEIKAEIARRKAAEQANKPISRPQFIAVPAAKPSEPATLEIAIRRVEEAPTENPMPVPRRVIEADLEEMCSWGIPRFLQRFPRLNRDGMLAFLRNAMGAPTVFFVRTPNANGLACATVTPWEPLPTVYETWVVSRETTVKTGIEVLSIYRAMADWAKQIGAVEFRFGSDTGVDITPIAERLGVQGKHLIHVLKLKD